MHTPQALIGEASFLAGAEKGSLRVYRRAGHCSRNRTHTEKKRDRIDANRFISCSSGDDELAAPCSQRLLALGMLQRSRSHCSCAYSFCLTTSSIHEKVFIMVGKPSVVVPNKAT